MQTRLWTVALVALLAGTLVGPAQAASLYTLDRASSRGLYEVDLETGATTLVGALPTDRGWSGLSSRPGDSRGAYATANAPLSTNPDGASWVFRIDVVTGAYTELLSVAPSDLGYQGNFLLEVSAIAIDPLDRDAAAMIGLVLDVDTYSIVEVAFSVDLTTGAITSPVHELDVHFDALTYSLDGSQLYTTINNTRPSAGGSATLATLDLGTGAIAAVGVDTGEPYMTGLAFHPENGDLYAVNAYATDALVLLDAGTGSITETIGPLGVPGPRGLAFVPEPQTAILLGVGLLFAVRRSSRASSRPSVRSAARITPARGFAPIGGVPGTRA